MIEAIEITRNHFVVKSIDPANGKVFQSATVYSEGDAIKFAYFVNRLYIVEKMNAWLNQRIRAFQVSGLEKQEIMAATFQKKIQDCAQTSVDHLKKLVADNEKTISFLAPGEKSRQFAYYNTIIRGIMEFCLERKEVAV